jgi:hypothetical protein
MTDGVLHRTGTMVSFETLDIGHPFFYYDRFWIRTDYEAGTQLIGSDSRRSEGKNPSNMGTCHFKEDDGTTWIQVETVTFTVS